jgi:hypothetical protein
LNAQKPIPDEPDIDEVGKKWKEEFGEKDGEAMVKVAHSLTEDFKYLWQFRL